MLSRNVLLVCGGLILSMLLGSAYFWSQLPDPSPVHWNLAGEPDGYGPRWLLTVLPPAMNVLLVGLFYVLPRLGPWRQNFVEFRFVYGRLVVAVIAMFAAMHFIFLLSAAGKNPPLAQALTFVFSLGLAYIGNSLGKVRRNFWIGIRTPWTLASEEVWERTHRVGAHLFVGYCLLCAALAFVLPGWWSGAVLLGGIVGITLWAVFYSLHWYRRLGVDDVAASRP